MSFAWAGELESPRRNVLLGFVVAWLLYIPHRRCPIQPRSHAWTHHRQINLGLFSQGADEESRFPHHQSSLFIRGIASPLLHRKRCAAADTSTGAAMPRRATQRRPNPHRGSLWSDREALNRQIPACKGLTAKSRKQLAGQPQQGGLRRRI